MRRLRDERGVAMVTVVFVGAVMTAVASTAALITFKELNAGKDDRKAAAALGYAEAGIDRLIFELEGGSVTWGDIRQAGCERPVLQLPTEVLGSGSFSAELTVYNPQALDTVSRFPPAACTARPGPREAQFFAITSTGQHPAAKRVVRQVIQAEPAGLPAALFAERFDINGNGTLSNVSLLSPGDVTGRDKVGFTGNDPYYLLSDFYPTMPATPIPAGAHAAGSIYFVGGGKNRREHPPSPNCDANSLGTDGQSVWDGSGDGGNVLVGCSGQTSFPPTSLFTQKDLDRVAPKRGLPEQDYLRLRETARSSGVYCSISSSGRSCTVAGEARTIGSEITDGDITGVPRTFVAYFEFVSGGDPYSNANTLGWKAAVGPCSNDPAVNESATVIVRNGSMKMASGAQITGAVLLPEGGLDSAGSYEIHGAVIADQVRLRGGATFSMSPCWVENMPSPLLNVTSMHWSELDR